MTEILFTGALRINQLIVCNILKWNNIYLNFDFYWRVRGGGQGDRKIFQQKEIQGPIFQKKYPGQGKFYNTLCINYLIANKKTGSRHR